MVTKPIGHSALIKRYESAKNEIKRLRDRLKRQNETLTKLRSELASKQVVTNMLQRPRCGCRHCLEVSKGGNHA